MAPARAESHISCYSKHPFPCSCPVLAVQMVDFFFLLPAILFFLLLTGLGFFVIMYESVSSRNTQDGRVFKSVQVKGNWDSEMRDGSAGWLHTEKGL